MNLFVWYVDIFPIFKGIDTDAITLIAGEDYRKKCRRPDIMADAAYTIITQDSRACTSNFFIDETLLRQHGVTDFDQYSVVPGTTELMPDFFVDENISQIQRQATMMSKGSSETNASGIDNVKQIFDRVKALITPDLLKKIDSIYAFDLEGKISLNDHFTKEKIKKAFDFI